MLEIDTSKAYNKNYGEREIVLNIRENMHSAGLSVYFRVNPKEFVKSLTQYSILRKILLTEEKFEILKTKPLLSEKTLIIDNRIVDIHLIKVS